MTTSNNGSGPDHIQQLPIIGICGRSGTGKTTLISKLIPRFLAIGLRLAVIKHGAQNVQVDRKGKDSFRFYEAGADVVIWGNERFKRWHDPGDFQAALTGLAGEYDLVLIEGHASTPVPSFWFCPPGDKIPPAVENRVLTTLTPRKVDVETVFAGICSYISQKWLKTPVWGCVLIGGKSSRMGTAKHLLVKGGETWLERTVASLAPKVEQVVISGRGVLPSSHDHLTRIADVPGLKGPMAGVLAAMRWQPRVSWLVAACDLPDLETGAFEWLLQSRKPGVWATIPDLLGKGMVEPLLAHYDFRSRPAMENLAAVGSLRLSELASTPGVITPQPPPAIQHCWRNVNTPEQLSS